MHNCEMRCDTLPCQNGGTCLEDFRSNTYKCDCEQTSYFGPACTEGKLYQPVLTINNRNTYILRFLFQICLFIYEEKGAHFRGDSYITAHYAPLDLDMIKIQLAFSTTAVRNIAQALLLIQTSTS